MKDAFVTPAVGTASFVTSAQVPVVVVTGGVVVVTGGGVVVMGGTVVVTGGGWLVGCGGFVPCGGGVVVLLGRFFVVVVVVVVDDVVDEGSVVVVGTIDREVLLPSEVEVSTWTESWLVRSGWASSPLLPANMATVANAVDTTTPATPSKM